MAEKDEDIIVIDEGQAFEEAFKRGLKDAEGLMYLYTKGGKQFIKDSYTRQYSSYMGGGHVKMKGYKAGGDVGYSMAGTGAAVKGTDCKGLF